MVGVGSSLSQLGAELFSLIRHTSRTIGALWVPVLALMLLGWAAQQLSVLLATEVLALSGWAVIAVLAIGAVLQLATIVTVLRLVAVHLGLPSMLAQASIEEAVDDDRDTSLIALLTITVLPFLAMYVAFGYLQQYAARVAVLSGYRKGLLELFGSLDPLENTTTLIAMIAILVAGYVFKKVAEPWQRRARYPLAVGMLRIVLEAFLAFVVLLGGFRLYQSFDIWLAWRKVTAWWEQLLQATFGPLPDAVRETLNAIWLTIGGQFWPLLFDGLARPLLWLAMAGLVFGTRVLTLADLWRLGKPVTHATTRRERVLAQLQAETDTARGLRMILLKLQSRYFGGVDQTIVPAWQSLRLVLRAGWPFLGAFIIAFTTLEFVGQQLDQWVTHLIGGQLIGVWITLYPFLDLIPMVLVMGITWVLLSVAYTRALSIFATRAGEGVTPVLVAGAPAMRRAFLSGPAQAITVVAVTALVVAGISAVPSELGSDDVRAAVQQSVQIHGQSITVAPAVATRSIVNSYGTTVTPHGIFVVVRVTVANSDSHAGKVRAQLTSAERSYPPWDAAAVAPPPGFKDSQDLVFEVDPGLVGPGTRLVFSVEGENWLLRGYQKTASIDLGFATQSAADARDVVLVSTDPQREAL